MKKLSIRKISLLGLVLLAASAVTAAILPKAKAESRTGHPGLLQDSTFGGVVNAQSCVTVSPGAGDCTATTGSSTTDDGPADSTSDEVNVTQDNTTANS